MEFLLGFLLFFLIIFFFFRNDIQVSLRPISLCIEP